MLNLLIAIISESFGIINSRAKQASNQERAKIIAENAYLIPRSRKKEMSDEEKYLIIAQVEKDDDQEDSVTNSIENLKDRLSSSQGRIESKLEAILEHYKVEDPAPSPKKWVQIQY